MSESDDDDEDKYEDEEERDDDDDEERNDREKKSVRLFSARSVPGEFLRTPLWRELFDNLKPGTRSQVKIWMIPPAFKHKKIPTTEDKALFVFPDPLLWKEVNPGEGVDKVLVHTVYRTPSGEFLFEQVEEKELSSLYPKKKYGCLDWIQSSFNESADTVYYYRKDSSVGDILLPSENGSRFLPVAKTSDASTLELLKQSALFGALRKLHQSGQDLDANRPFSQNPSVATESDSKRYAEARATARLGGSKKPKKVQRKAK